MKLFDKQLALKFNKPNWARDPLLAVADTILEKHRELYDIVRGDLEGLSKDSKMACPPGSGRRGRKDIPTVEQIVRAALYKEAKGLNYRELEYAEDDSRLCEEFLRLKGRESFSYQVLQKYISKISPETLKKLLIAINKIAIENNLEDGKRVATDSTVVETNIHYPTNNALVWDGIKKLNRLLKKINKAVGEIRLQNTTKQAKKNYCKINMAKKEKREELFISQLGILKRDIKRAKKAVEILLEKGMIDYAEELRSTVEVVEKVYEVAYRGEILGESVPSSEKVFSIHEQHTDIIVKGDRTVEFGHKINLGIGRSNLILDCIIPDGNPKDSELYPGTMQRITENYNVQIHDGVTDGGYASKVNALFAKKLGIVNIVFNKLVGSLKNTVTSKHMETRLKKWRSAIEAVISNVKRGFDLRRCEWKGRTHFDAKVLWGVIAYNIRVISGLLLKKLRLA